MISLKHNCEWSVNDSDYSWFSPLAIASTEYFVFKREECDSISILQNIALSDRLKTHAKQE